VLHESSIHNRLATVVSRTGRKSPCLFINPTTNPPFPIHTSHSFFRSYTAILPNSLGDFASAWTLLVKQGHLVRFVVRSSLSLTSTPHTFHGTRRPSGQHLRTDAVCKAKERRRWQNVGKRLPFWPTAN